MARTIRFCFLYLSYLVKKSFGIFNVGDPCDQCGPNQVCSSGRCACRSDYFLHDEFRQCFRSDSNSIQTKIPFIIFGVVGGVILFCIIFSLTKMYIMVRKDRQRIRLRRQQNHISPLAPSLVINEPHLYQLNNIPPPSLVINETHLYPSTISTSYSTTSTSTGLTRSSNSTNICFATPPTSPRTTIIPTAPPIQFHSSGTYPITYEIDSAASIQLKPSDLAPNYFGIPKIEVDDGLPSYEDATKTKMNTLPDNNAN